MASLWTAVFVALVGSGAGLQNVILAPALVKLPANAPLPAGERNISIATARNEYESVQIFLQGPMTTVQVSVLSTSGLDARLYATRHVNVTKPTGCIGKAGLWSDALVPDVDAWYSEKRNAFPLNVPAGQLGTVWVDLYTPSDTIAGDRNVLLQLESEQGTTNLSIAVRVFNFTLSSIPSLATHFGIGGLDSVLKGHDLDPGFSSANELYSHYLDAGLGNRVSLANFLAGSSEDDIRAAAGDISAFDRTWGRYLRGTDLPWGLRGTRLTALQLPAPLCRLSSDRAGHVHNCTSSMVAEQIAYWANLTKGFSTKTLGGSNATWTSLLYDYTIDEPSAFEKNATSVAWHIVAERNAWLKQADPSLRALVTTDMSDAASGGVAQDIGLWVPIINYMWGQPSCRLAGNHRADYNNISRNNLWWYQSCMSYGCGDGGCHPPCETNWPSYAVDHPAVKHRVMDWASFLLDMGGELYYSTDVNFRSSDPWNDLWYAGGNGDGSLFYPGTPSAIGGKHHIPVESLRLKTKRDGVEDHAYLSMLAQVGGRSEAATMAEGVLSSPFDFTMDPDVLYNTRIKIAEAIEAAQAR